MMQYLLAIDGGKLYTWLTAAEAGRGTQASLKIHQDDGAPGEMTSLNDLIHIHSVVAAENAIAVYGVPKLPKSAAPTSTATSSTTDKDKDASSTPTNN
jgi:hypothetical protein